MAALRTSYVPLYFVIVNVSQAYNIITECGFIEPVHDIEAVDVHNSTENGFYSI